MHLKSIILLGTVALSAPLIRASAQSESATSSPCRSTVLAEQLRQGCFDFDVLSREIPGFADIEVDEPPSCSFTVFLADPSKDAVRAKELLAPLLPASPAMRQRCAPGGIKVRRSRYTRVQLNTAARQVENLIGSMGYTNRSYSEIDTATIVVTAHNRRAVTRLRAALRNDAGLKAYPIVVELADGAQELDPPIVPPRAASLAILDSLKSKFARRRIAVDMKTIPTGVTIADVSSRGFRASTPADTDCTTRVLSFAEPRMYEDGRVMFKVNDGDRNIVYEVWCARGVCATRWPEVETAISSASSCKGHWQDRITS